MQRSAYVIGSIVALAGGCVLNNPKFGDGGDASASATTGEAATSASTSHASSSSSSTTSSSTSGASAGETTSGASEGTSTSTTTATSDATTEAASTSGGWEDLCPPGEEPRLDLLVSALADTMVVKPGLGGVCAGLPECSALNYGSAGYLEMYNDELEGQSLFLVRFDLSAYPDRLLEVGVDDPADVIAFRLRLVFWQNTGAPDADWTFDVATVPAVNAGWRAGGQSGGIAGDGESSYDCRNREQGSCELWDGADGPLGDAVEVATFVLTPEAAAMGEEEDPDIADQYHAHVLSSPIPAAKLTGWISQPLNPGFVVYLADTKAPNGQLNLGIKPMEPTWSDPTLFVEHCVPMEDEGTTTGGGG